MDDRPAVAGWSGALWLRRTCPLILLICGPIARCPGPHRLRTSAARAPWGGARMIRAMLVPSFTSNRTCAGSGLPSPRARAVSGHPVLRGNTEEALCSIRVMPAIVSARTDATPRWQRRKSLSDHGAGPIRGPVRGAAYDFGDPPESRAPQAVHAAERGRPRRTQHGFCDRRLVPMVHRHASGCNAPLTSVALAAGQSSARDPDAATNGGS